MAGTRSITRYAKRILSRWYYFIFVVFLTVPLAYAYLHLTPREYEVRASIMITGSPNQPEKQGQQQTAESTAKGVVDDEVRILKSNSIIERTLRGLDFGVSYYVRNKFAVREEYGNRYFSILLDSSVNQITDVPVYVRRISSTRYRVKVSARDARLYNCFSSQLEGAVAELEIDEEVPIDKPLGNKYLNFTIAFNDRYKVEAGDEMFFVVRPLQSLTETFQRKLEVSPVSSDSRIVELIVTGEVPDKEKTFLNELIRTYLEMSSEKQNVLALQTLRFIDNQLSNRGDTLSERMRGYLMEKHLDARMAMASATIDENIVDRPYTAYGGLHVSPRDEAVYPLALLAGFCCAILFMVAKDLWTNTVITGEDVEAITKFPLIGTINHANKREQNAIVAHARSAVGESFRSLRVNLQYLTLGGNASVIGVTSSREGEGKTFCSVNLAAVMAYSGRRIVLIDTDMRRPRVASYFQLENRKGLSNFLVGDGAIKEIINSTEHKGFDVIGSGPIPPNPIDLIGNPRMGELIATLKQSYSTIILDSPPLGYVSEYIILMKYTDANLYIVRSDYTNRNSLQKINKLVDREKLSSFSIVLNDVQPSKESGNYYTYGYDYKY